MRDLRRPLVRVLLQPRAVPLDHPGHRPLSLLRPVRSAVGHRRRTGWAAGTEHVRARILDDLDAIAAAAVELVEDRVTYEQALSDYFADLLRAHRGDPSPIWSIDDVHADYILGASKKI
jgi:hypothetical protein